MTDTTSQTCAEYEYRVPWATIGLFAWLPVLVVLTWAHAVEGYLGPCPVGMTATLVVCLSGLIYVSLAVFFALLILRMILHGRKRSRRIALTETSIVVPMRPWSSQPTSVSYDTITEISWTWWLGRKEIHMRHAAGTLTISGVHLPADGDADEILRILSERTSLTVVPPSPWPIQLSLVLMFLVITGVAALLGMRMWVAPRLGWDELWILITAWTLLSVSNGIVLWLMTSAPRSARVFAVGFALGAILEGAAMSYCVKHDLLQLAPGTCAPMGSYPLSVPIERILVLCSGAALELWRTLLALLIGCVASGAICGVFAVVVWYLGRYAMRRLSTGH